MSDVQAICVALVVIVVMGGIILAVHRENMAEARSEGTARCSRCGYVGKLERKS